MSSGGKLDRDRILVTDADLCKSDKGAREGASQPKSRADDDVDSSR